jgi:hypothetical protein
MNILGANKDRALVPTQETWTCDHCGKVDLWGLTWAWWGNVCRRAGWYDDGTMQWVACSDVCAAALKARGRAEVRK